MLPSYKSIFPIKIDTASDLLKETRDHYTEKNKRQYYSFYNIILQIHKET